MRAYPKSSKIRLKKFFKNKKALLLQMITRSKKVIKILSANISIFTAAMKMTTTRINSKLSFKR